MNHHFIHCHSVTSWYFPNVMNHHLIQCHSVTSWYFPNVMNHHLIQCHSVTSQETWNLSNIAVRTSNFTSQCVSCITTTITENKVQNAINTFCTVCDFLAEHGVKRCLLLCVHLIGPSGPRLLCHTQSLSIQTLRGKISSQILNPTKDCLPLVTIYFICFKMNVFSQK